MNSSFYAAAIQMSSGESPQDNLRAAEKLVERAAERGAQLVVLPEMFLCYGRSRQILAATEEIPGATSATLGALARRLGITLVAGSYAEQSSQPDKAYNASLLFGPDGTLLAKYRKRHLFDLDIPGQVSARESSWLLPGDEICVTATSCGKIGQAICYDLRFPEHFRAMIGQGAEIICLPSAFTLATGRDHWKVLLRARAIENQAYVIAPNQFGTHAPGLTTYGRSMIIDPWGTVVGCAADGENLVIAELDPARVIAVRERLPALAHRRDKQESA